jgi:hypothetical protein
MAIQNKRNKRHSNRDKIELIEGISGLGLLNLAFVDAKQHLIQKSQEETNREVKAAFRMSKNLQTFLDYPLSSTLLPSLAGPEAEQKITLLDGTFTALGDKDRLLKAIETLFNESRLNLTLRDDVLLVANEFICNGLFNAPRPNGINNENFEKARQTAKQVNCREGRLKIGAYKGFLALSCQDKYGSLNPKRVLERVKICLENGAGEAISVGDKGTAGIGSFLVFNACTSLFIGVKSDVATQFCALFPLKMGAKGRLSKPKNLHWIKA